MVRYKCTLQVVNISKIHAKLSIIKNNLF